MIICMTHVLTSLLTRYTWKQTIRSTAKDWSKSAGTSFVLMIQPASVQNRTKYIKVVKDGLEFKLIHEKLYSSQLSFNRQEHLVVLSELFGQGCCIGIQKKKPRKNQVSLLSDNDEINFFDTYTEKNELLKRDGVTFVFDGRCCVLMVVTYPRYIYQSIHRICEIPSKLVELVF